MLKSERKVVGTDPLYRELKRLRKENYGLLRALEKETLARQRVEIDLRMLQMELEDKTGKEEAWVKTEAGGLLAVQPSGYNGLLGPLSFSSPLSSTLSPERLNHSPSHSNKKFSSPSNSECLGNFSASTPCPKTTVPNGNFYELNRNITVIKDVNQMPALERNVQRKNLDKSERPASKPSKNSKKRARESDSVGAGDQEAAENSSLGEKRKRQYVFCEHCRTVRHLLPIVDKKGRSQAFRHTCKTPSGTKRAQQTLRHKSNTCRETHDGPCLRRATAHEIEQVFVLLNDGVGEVDTSLTPTVKLGADSDTP